MSGLEWMTRILTQLIPTSDIHWSFTKEGNFDRVDSRLPILVDSVIIDL